MWEYEAEFLVSAFVGEVPENQKKKIPKSGDLRSIDRINVRTEVNPSLALNLEQYSCACRLSLVCCLELVQKQKGLDILAALLRKVRLREPCDLRKNVK